MTNTGDEMLEGYKAIADKLHQLTGRNVHWSTVQRLTQREKDENPLPVRVLLRRVLIATSEVMAWLDRESRATRAISS